MKQDDVFNSNVLVIYRCITATVVLVVGVLQAPGMLGAGGHVCVRVSCHNWNATLEGADGVVRMYPYTRHTGLSGSGIRSHDFTRKGCRRIHGICRPGQPKQACLSATMFQTCVNGGCGWAFHEQTGVQRGKQSSCWENKVRA